MHLTDLLTRDHVLFGVRARNKAALLKHCAAQAAAASGAAAEDIFAALSARERLGSTGFGRGFALPHARVEGVRKLLGLFARLARPIPFDAIDGAPVDLVFLLLIPPGAGTDHVAALAAVARAMRDEKRRQTGAQRNRRRGAVSCGYLDATNLTTAARRTPPMSLALTYIVTLVIFAVIDAGWIGFVALPMFKSALGADMLTFRPIPGILFYLLQAAGLLIFVYPLAQTAGTRSLIYGGLFGLFTYATYDLTNYSTLKPYTLQLTISDIVWGTVLNAVTATAALWIASKITRS